VIVFRQEMTSYIRGFDHVIWYSDSIARLMMANFFVQHLAANQTVGHLLTSSPRPAPCPAHYSRASQSTRFTRLYSTLPIYSPARPTAFFDSLVEVVAFYFTN